MSELRRMQDELRALDELQEQMSDHPEVVMLIWGYKQSLLDEIDDFRRAIDPTD